MAIFKCARRRRRLVEAAEFFAPRRIEYLWHEGFLSTDRAWEGVSLGIRANLILSATR